MIKKEDYKYWVIVILLVIMLFAGFLKITYESFNIE